MKLSEEQYQAVLEAFINNPVLDNFRMWVEDGQLTDEEVRTLINHIFTVVDTE